MDILWSGNHLLVTELISLIRHDIMKRKMHMELSEEYDMLPINFLCHLYLDLNTLWISVEEEAGYINLPIMLEIWFDTNYRTFGKMNIPTLSFLALSAHCTSLLLQTPILSSSPDQFLAHSKIYHSVWIMWTPLSNITLSKMFSLRRCISHWLNVGETLPVLDNWNIMCLSWSLCGIFSVDWTKHRCHEDHYHLNGSKHYHSLIFKWWYCQQHVPHPLNGTTIPLHAKLPDII